MVVGHNQGSVRKFVQCAGYQWEGVTAYHRGLIYYQQIILSELKVHRIFLLVGYWNSEKGIVASAVSCCVKRT